MKLSRKLAYIKEDFLNGKFELEEARATYEDLIKGPDVVLTESEGRSSKESKKKKLISAKIEAIHAGATRNHTFYTVEKLKGDINLHSGVFSCMYPYPKPILTHHNTYNGDPIGRIKSASFETDTKAGKPGLVVVADITEADAAEKVKDKRYLTVSIGAHTDSVTCSICGTDIINDGRCEHLRGEKYDGVTCQWMIGNLWIDEISYVDVPSCETAMTVAIEYDSESDMEESKMPTDNSVATPESTLENVDSATNAEATQNVEESLQNTTTEQEETKAKVADLIIPATRVEGLEDLIKQTVLQLVSEHSANNEEETEEADDKEIKDLKDQVEQLNASIANLQAENKKLLEQNAELTAKLHQNLAEKVVDYKITLKKISADQREEEIKQHVLRTEESLNDALNDLLNESKGVSSTTTPRKVEQITNPGVALEEKDKQKETKQESLVELEDAVKFLFSPKKK